MAKCKRNSEQRTFDSFSSVPSMPEGYFSGDRPNPHLRQFIEDHRTPYDPRTDKYRVGAFCEAIVTTKATAVYNMHVYWSKKPHDAIRQYVRHFAPEGSIVLDPFCGSGGTALAALMEGRKAVAVDRSPAATFLTKNHCTPVDPSALRLALVRLQQHIAQEIEWLYETRCDRCGKKAITGYTVYSKVFQCSRCLAKVPLYDCIEVEVTGGNGKTKHVPVCPLCHPKHVEPINTDADNTYGTKLVYVAYQCESGCRPRRGERTHNDNDPRKREFFEQYDLGKLSEIEGREIPYWYPSHRMMNDESNDRPWGEKWRAGTSSFRTVAELFTKRNLWALATIKAGINAVANGALADVLLFALTGILLNSSKMYQEREGGRSIAKGTYYLPAISRDMVVTNGYYYKLEQQLIPAYQELQSLESTSLVISTQSATRLDSIPANSIDYVFTDPPYANKVQYGELNFVWEAWLNADTRWHDEEIIINDVRGKSEADWAAMMKQAMAECYRVLKPGRWLSLCYHDTSEGTWELIQDIMAEVGFAVDRTESALFIDTGQKSYNQLTADKSTKRDLVLNFYKPRPSDLRITEYIPDTDESPTFQDAATQVVRDYLTAHPGATKDRVYDALVSRMVSKGQMEAHNFEALLRSVAEEVRQPVKEDLFDNREPDLFGSHITSRWYLRATADHIDQAEQEKEDAVAERLERFMASYFKEHPEVEGVHYSDLFEQYLPVKDKPRRLLADWLPEYFFKTTDGTWRSPADEQERQQKAALREAGTLRRMKRFGNALIDGVPIRDQDRPANDRTLAEWIRQCRRAGLYEQGRALYEKGGLNLENLGDEEQIAVEDDYRICVKRKGEDGAKPRRQRRKKDADE